MEKVIIFDTTLRDGEQSPGATLNINEKLRIAQQLEKLNVDVIEAGFPAASDGDFEAVKKISESISKPVICGLARCRKEDIEKAAKAIESAKNARIHTFIATSQIHMKHKLKMGERDVLDAAEKHVKLAKTFTEDVEFSPEDAGRSQADFLYKVIERVIDAGATTINIPDTVGYTQPHEFGNLIKGIKENVSNIDSVIISAHCHDDLGLSVANSMEAIKAGARQIEGTINGIGERAGNTALEEVIMNLYSRNNFYNFETQINLREIFNTSRLVSDLTGLIVQANKAIVGKNAFAHEAGIHQHGILANREVYEIIDPSIIGMSTELIIGKHSGKAAIKDFLNKNSVEVSEAELEKITGKIKSLADKEKEIFNDDVLAIAYDVKSKSGLKELITVKDILISTSLNGKPTAKTIIIFKGNELSGEASGVGPVDAMCRAFSNALNSNFEIKEYNLKAITGGTDALANVTIKINYNGKDFSGRAINQDITMSSAKALLNSLNKAFAFNKNHSNFMGGN